MGLSQSFPPKRGGKARPQTGFHFTVQKRPTSGSVPGTSGASLPKRPHLESGNEAHLSSKKSRSAFLMCQSPQLLQPPPHVHLQLFRLVCFSNVLINEEALHPTGLCLIWFRITIFSLGPVLPCSMTSGNLMSRQQQLIILLFRGRLMRFWLRVQLNPLLVVLVSILACLWCLSILGTSNPYLTCSILIIICIYLLLRCQLLDMYASSVVIMLFPLIYRMHIYIFLLLSIIIVSYVLFGIMCLINRRFCLLGWPQPLGFYVPHQTYFVPLPSQGFAYCYVFG